MKWFVLIMFLSFNEDGSMDSFVFTEPNFNDEASCRATLTDMIEINKYVYIMMQKYNGVLPGPVHKVNCIDENAFENLLRIQPNASKGVSL